MYLLRKVRLENVQLKYLANQNRDSNIMLYVLCYGIYYEGKAWLQNATDQLTIPEF